jgi:hypothetical protein
LDNKRNVEISAPLHGISYHNFINAIKSPATKEAYATSLRRYLNHIKLKSVDDLLLHAANPQALSLINDVNKYRTELVTNGVIVNDALRIVQSKMEHLNGNGKGEEKRLLKDIREDFEDINKEEEEVTTNGVF